MYVYCSPTLQIGKHKIHEAADALTNNLGSQDLRGILRVSSNVGMAQFGLRLGAPRLYKYEQKFGFLDYPGSGLPGEQKSYLLAPGRAEPVHRRHRLVADPACQYLVRPGHFADPAAACFGLLRRSRTAATLMRPHIIKAVRKDGVETPIAPEPVRRVVSPGSRRRRPLHARNGGRRRHRQARPDRGLHGRRQDRLGSGGRAARLREPAILWRRSAALYPLSHPRLVILCAIFEPQGIHWGAAVAAPVVHNIARAAMLQLQIPPDAPGRVDWDDHTKMASRSNRRRGVMRRTTWPRAARRISRRLGRRGGITGQEGHGIN